MISGGCCSHTQRQLLWLINWHKRVGCLLLLLVVGLGLWWDLAQKRTTPNENVFSGGRAQKTFCAHLDNCASTDDRGVFELGVRVFSAVCTVVWTGLSL